MKDLAFTVCNINETFKYSTHLYAKLFRDEFAKNIGRYEIKNYKNVQESLNNFLLKVYFTLDLKKKSKSFNVM